MQVALVTGASRGVGRGVAIGMSCKSQPVKWGPLLDLAPRATGDSPSISEEGDFGVPRP
jgi:hypothetical protein